MHSELCPVCKGEGEIGDGDKTPRTCNGCGGRGWVSVNGETNEDKKETPNLLCESPAKVMPFNN